MSQPLDMSLENTSTPVRQSRTTRPEDEEQVEDDYFTPKAEEDSSLRLHHSRSLEDRWSSAMVSSSSPAHSIAAASSITPGSPAPSSILTATPSQPPARRRSIRTRTSVRLSPQNTPTRSRSSSDMINVPRSPHRSTSRSRSSSKGSFHQLAEPLQDVIEDIYDGEGPPESVLQALSRAQSVMSRTTTDNSSIDHYIFGSAAVGRNNLTSGRSKRDSRASESSSIAQRRSKVLRPPPPLIIRSVSADNVRNLTSTQLHDDFHTTLQDLKSMANATDVTEHGPPVEPSTPGLTDTSMSRSDVPSTVALSEITFAESPLMGKSSPSHLRNASLNDWLGDTPKRMHNSG